MRVKKKLMRSVVNPYMYMYKNVPYFSPERRTPSITAARERIMGHPVLTESASICHCFDIADKNWPESAPFIVPIIFS